MIIFWFTILGGQKYMCGIAGEIGWNIVTKNRLGIYNNMNDTLNRRGPDQKNIYIDEHVALIHSRLCVIDIENGKQPMIFVRGNEKYILVYNGEIYNTLELKNELKNLGHNFIGHSDTEILLHSYVEWKSDCVKKLNGIYAFAIWESHNERLFIARDRIGVKPFFYSLKGQSFIFGSEIKTLLAHPDVEPKIDINSIREILLIGPGRTSGYGIFCDIDELKPGYCGFYDKNNFKIWKYWDLKDKENNDSLNVTIEKVKFLIKDSIERQLVSDVPTGTFLSGGIDSSIISSVANQYFKKHNKKLQTFSVDYKDNDIYFQANKFQPNSDNEYINEMNKYLNVENHKIILDTNELVDALFSAVDARDLPGMTDVDSSLLLFCKEIKKYVTVALSGECADEIFGGYPWYRDKTIRNIDGFPWSQSANYRLSFLNKDFKSEIHSEYVNKKYKETIEQTNILPVQNDLEKRMKQMVNLNLKWFMQTLLDRKDRMSMYNGLEVRVPFCDYRIVEYLYTVPWKYKDYNNIEKGLLREAMKDYLPQKVLTRKKSPYPKTYNPKYLQMVSSRLMDTINDSNSPILQFIDKKRILELISQSANRKSVNNWYGQLMTTPQTIAYFLQINYWLKKYKIYIV